MADAVLGIVADDVLLEPDDAAEVATDPDGVVDDPDTIVENDNDNDTDSEAVAENDCEDGPDDIPEPDLELRPEPEIKGWVEKGRELNEVIVAT